MGRRGSSQPLAIWANGELVGRWTPATRRPMELRYEDSWLASRSARPLSLSLPLPLVGNEPIRGDRVEHFFDNLLPDRGVIRKRLAQRYAAGSEDTFDLLAAIGRDCGATTNGNGGWPISAGDGCSSSGASGSWLKRTNHSAASRRARVLATAGSFVCRFVRTRKPWRG